MSGTETINLTRLRFLLSQKLTFNSAQTDQDFAGPSSNRNAILDEYLFEAYTEEVNLAKIEVGYNPFLFRSTLTWSASSQTLMIPRRLLDHQIYRIDDETDSTPGQVLWIGTDGGRTTTVAWRDRDTLQWGTTGPASARTLTAFYSGMANKMTEATQEPDLIPPQYRHLLVWSAAIIGRMEADEMAPPSWLQRRDELRRQFWLLLSRGQVVFPLGYTIMEPAQGLESY